MMTKDQFIKKYGQELNTILKNVEDSLVEPVAKEKILTESPDLEKHTVKLKPVIESPEYVDKAERKAWERIKGSYKALIIKKAQAEDYKEDDYDSEEISAEQRGMTVRNLNDIINEEDYRKKKIKELRKKYGVD